MLLLLPVLLLAACGQPGGYRNSEYGGLPYGASPSLVPQRYYPPPGPPDDPWGPYIREAATRYGVPGQWVRAVMHQELDGQEQAVSPVGAMGLMQVMPQTYEELRVRYGLGDDPYDPHNNILAGAAYIREMYDRYGAPGFLAGYNAGPQRVDSYLAGTADLPDETVNYLAAVTPNLGNAVPLSGPLAIYASARGGGVSGIAPSVTSLAAGCDLNAAYDPDHPCTSLVQAAAASAPAQLALAEQRGANGCDLSAAYDPDHPCTSVEQVAAATPSAAPQPSLIRQAAANGCDLDAAYDPDHPCSSAGQAIAAEAAAPAQLAMVQHGVAGGCDPDAAYDPDHPCRPTQPVASGNQLAFAAASVASSALPPPLSAKPVAAATSYVAYRPAPSSPSSPFAASGGAGSHLLAIPIRDWAIQVGAFANPALARAVAEGARAQAPDQLRSATLALPPTPFRGSVLYRARLAHLSASAASDACTHLNRRQLPCVVVQPNRS